MTENEQIIYELQQINIKLAIMLGEHNLTPDIKTKYETITTTK